MIEELARVVGVEVREADAAFAEELSRLPLAQKRTSKNKAYVRVGQGPPFEGTILKGPYAPHSLKLVNNLRYPHLLQLAEELLRLPPVSRGAYRWTALVVDRSGAAPSYYLAGPNVGNPAAMKVESVSTLVDPSCHVIVRGTLLRRVSEIEKVKVGSRYRRHPDFDEQIAVASLQHLYLRHLFNVGDSGTHNILIRMDRHADGQFIAGIDYDEHRREGEGRSLWDCFCKSDYAYMDDIYGEFVPRIVLVGTLDPMLLTRIDELNALGRRWAECLPPSRRSEGVVEVSEMVRRNERIRSLITGSAAVPGTAADPS